jgi:dynein heavy chain
MRWARGLCDVCVEVHRSVETASLRFLQEEGRFNYVTPTSYLQLLRTFVRLLTSCRETITDRLGRYELGLDKLLKCGVLVEGLQQDLIKMQPVLQQKERETGELLVRVERDRADAAVRRDAAAADAAVAKTAREEVQVIKDDCQSELDQAMPAYYSAVKALQTLDKKSITEVKSYVNPPEMVDVTMQAVCILLHIKPEWKEAKLLLNDMGFLQRLMDYDKDSIPSSIIRKIKKFANDPRFEPRKVGKVSEACRCLCAWVLAMYKYDAVVKLIGPKKIALGKAEEKLAVVEAELAEKNAQLATIEQNLAALESQYNSSIQTKKDLEQRMTKCKTELERANRLTTSLADEKVRWSAEARRLRGEVKDLPGNVAVAAANIAYLGAFTAPYRKQLTREWRELLSDNGVPIGGAPHLAGVLGKAVETRQWRLDGLPADEFSTENGIMATRNALRWPLMIDPQRQANGWVRRTYAQGKRNGPTGGQRGVASGGGNGQALRVCKPAASDLLRTLENAVRYGSPVLLEDVPESGLDAVLDPILLRQLAPGPGGQLCLTIGDNQVPYDPNFRLFITTRIANPHFLPEMSIKVSLINFSITVKGLEDQLLVDVVQNERPELEERRDALVLSIAADQAELSGLEDQILSLLANAGSDILEDEELINTLQKSKVTSTSVTARVKESVKVAEEVGAARNVYRPVAARGSVIYFCVAALAQLDAMYQYSLSYYSVLYRQRIMQSAKSDDVELRIQILIDDITVRIYQNICRGLFDRHRLLFSFRIAVEVQRAEGRISGKEWKMLLAGSGVDEEGVEGAEGGGSDATAATRNDSEPAKSGTVPEWCEPAHWHELLAAEKALPGTLGGVSQLIHAQSATWARWAESREDDLPPMPVPSLADLENEEAEREKQKEQAGEKTSNLASSASAGALFSAATADSQAYTLLAPLVLTRVLRKDKLITSVRAFVKRFLGATFVEPTPFDLEGCYNDSTNDSPLIFVLSSGANPMEALLKAAAARGKRRGMKVVSLGQGQGPIAEIAMQNGARSGEWVVLENCHLAQSWLPVLDNMLTDAGILGDEDLHPDFRLWLTSMPCAYFPVPTLQKGIKITTEPPRGLKANLRRTFADLSVEDFESGCAERMIQPWTRLVFALSFYNAVCLERKKFGAVGWNKQTDWMNSDLKTAMAQLKLYLEEVPIPASEWGKPGVAEASVPLRTLTEVIGAVTYGGRITDRWDKRCNVNLLAQFFRPEVISGLTDETSAFASASTPASCGLIALSESGLYRTPEETVEAGVLKLSAVRAHIENLPDVETPEVFGLGGNAAIVFSLQEADTFLSDAMNCEAGGGGDTSASADGADAAAVAEEQAMLQVLRGRLPSGGKLGDACAATVAPLVRQGNEMINPIGIFAGQEAVQLEALWRVVDDDLAVLADAVVGLAVMSDDNERSLEAVRFQRVPPSWLKAGYPSLKGLGGWIDDFVRRWTTLRTWISQGPPVVYWLSGYFFPQGWITGLLQTHSRVTGIPVDKLGFDVEVCRTEPTERPRHGAFISGLFLQGARWDRRNGAAGCLADAVPGELFDKMPSIKLLPVELVEEEAGGGGDGKKKTYSCPVYKTLERRGVLSTTGLSTNFIVALELPMSGGHQEAFWVRRGAAMIAALD